MNPWDPSHLSYIYRALLHYMDGSGEHAVVGLCFVWSIFSTSDMFTRKGLQAMTYAPFNCSEGGW
jgi:hypothetical protein